MWSTSGAHSLAVSSTAGSCSIRVTSWPRLARSDARWRPTAPAPLMTTRISVLRGRLEDLLQHVERVPLHDHGGVVALLERARADRDESFPAAVDPGHQDLAFDVDGRDWLPDQVLRNLDPHAEQVARERFLDLLAGVLEHQDHLLDAPAGGGDRGDVQTFVDVGAHRVVDAGDDLRHVIGLAGDPGRDDVRVVSARHRQEGVGLLDPGLLEDLAVEPEPDQRARLEPRGQPRERRGVLVDDRDLVALLGQLLREQDAHTTTTHDDHAHGWLP